MINYIQPRLLPVHQAPDLPGKETGAAGRIPVDKKFRGRFQAVPGIWIKKGYYLAPPEYGKIDSSPQVLTAA